MPEAKLNEEQKKVISLLESRKNVFVSGSGGTGKTYLIKYFVEHYKNVKNIGLTSTTGISAGTIGGTTINSFLGIGLGKSTSMKLAKKIIDNGFLEKRVTTLDILIIDEISMMNYALFQKIEEVFRIVRKSKKPFGGVQLLLSGDFLQLPAVKCEYYCFESEVWNNVIDETVILTKIIRQSNLQFQNILNKIRNGIVDKEVKDVIKSRFKKNIEKNGITPTRIYTINKDVDRINEEALDKIAENNEDIEFFEYDMNIEYIEEETKQALYLVDKFKKTSRIKENLQLCIGCQVLLIKNLDIENGLVNGSRGVVVKFTDEDIPIIKFMNGQEVVIRKEQFEIETDYGKKVAIANQLPLRLGYATTVHSCQGLTIDCAEINLLNIFDYGMGYTALSRVKSLETLSILGINFSKIIANEKVLEFYEPYLKK